MLFRKVSLRTCIVISIFGMSLLGVVLAMVIGSLYRQSAIDNQQQHLEQVIKLKSSDILENLTNHSRRLGETLQNNTTFRESYQNNDIETLNRLLDSQYHQYFVTAGLTKLENLSIYNSGLKFITNKATSPEKSKLFKNIPCGNLVSLAKQRTGPGRLKILSQLCNVDKQMLLSVLVPIGGIFEDGYIEITTDPSYNLQQIGNNLGLPVKITSALSEEKYFSSDWPKSHTGTGITPTYTLTAINNEPGLNISIYKDLDKLEYSLAKTRNMALTIAFFTTVFVAVIFLSILQRTTFNPLKKLGNELDKILKGTANFGHTLDVKGNTEIQDLTMRFNEMVLSLKDTYGKIELARDGAIEANKAKSQFLANMSHELRTPLNAVIGYAEMLDEDPRISNNEEITNDVAKIRSAASHLLKMIDEVLDLSKIEAGRMDLVLEPFSVNKTMTEICETVAPLVNKNNNTLTVNTSSTNGSIYADITKFRQTLYNIISNACKFTENGNIIINAERHFKTGKEWIVIVVKDSGIGISEENIKRLFNVFQQVESTTSKKYGGTGLGLAISKRFCNMMGGDVTVSSTPNKGSTFVITLPVKVEAADINKIVPMEDYIFTPAEASQGRTRA